jgi:hypothetical protein
VHGKLGSLCPCIKGLLARLAAQVYNPQDIPSSYTTQTHLLYTNISQPIGACQLFGESQLSGTHESACRSLEILTNHHGPH